MIKNRKELLKGLPNEERNAREFLLNITEKVLEEINPFHLVLKELGKIDYSKYDRIFVIGAGKGASKMAEAAEKILGKKNNGRICDHSRKRTRTET